MIIYLQMSPQVRRMSHDAAVTILVVGALDDIVIAMIMMMMMITIVTMMMMVTMSTCLYLICLF